MRFLLKLVFLRLFDLEIRPISSQLLSKIIRSSKKLGTGSFGSYYQLSNNRGIKLLHQEFKTFEAASHSLLYHEAKEEAGLMRLAKSRYSNVPECYGIKIINVDCYFRVGIVMQHLGTEKAVNLEISKDDGFKWELREKLKQVGIIHNDLHYNNIMLFKGDWWIIDFSPEFITVEN